MVEYNLILTTDTTKNQTTIKLLKTWKWKLLSWTTTIKRFKPVNSDDFDAVKDLKRTGRTVFLALQK